MEIPLTDNGRTTAIRKVLWQVMALNLVVAVAKLAWGLYSGAISMVADGVHSFMDSSSNVIGLIGTAVAARPPDHGHPYGHRKFEVIAALGITFLLFMAAYEILTGAVTRLASGEPPRVTATSYVVMLVTIAINTFVTIYERRRGLALRSPILVADSLHTRSDIYASIAVLAGLTGAALQRPWLDPLAAFVVVALIARAGFRIVAASLDVLADARVYHPDAIAAAALEIPGVIDCHDIRTRGLPDHVHLDFHLTVAPETPTSEAHAIAHKVVDAIQKRFPGIRDVTPHVEPPEEAGGAGGGP
ncbi:MAG TPA: cation diffusion facilitator family transporter [Candidatus Polarisedimenticolia bacterium]|nr:cation diffusion facilitator family transporter [Candidatus Polarisedimenticolia bacterium]